MISAPGLNARPLAPRRGKAALDQLYRGVKQPGQPLLFLDLDDVICLNSPYGGYDVFQPSSEQPADLWERLWHPPAVQTLLEVIAEHRPSVVMTTSWLRLLELEGFVALFRRTGLGAVADAFHPK